MVAGCFSRLKQLRLLKKERNGLEGLLGGGIFLRRNCEHYCRIPRCVEVGSFTAVHVRSRLYISGLEIWSWRRSRSWVETPPQDSPITPSYCYTSGGNYCALGAGYYPPLISLIHSKSSSLYPNACSHSKVQRLPLKARLASHVSQEAES